MEKEWYVVNTYSGHESKVKEKLEMRAESMGFQDNIFRIIIPEETVKEQQKDGSFKKVYVKLGTSDGINVQVLSGITKDDQIKVWNPSDKDKEALKAQQGK